MQSDAKCMSQSSSMRKTKIPARHINSKQFASEDNRSIFLFTKTTKMIQMQENVKILDKAEETLKKIPEVYSTVLRDGDVQPLPDGSQK